MRCWGGRVGGRTPSGVPETMRAQTGLLHRGSRVRTARAAARDRVIKGRSGVSRKGLLYVLGVVALMLSVTVAGQALAGKKKLTRDRAALQAVPQGKDRATERRIDSLIRRMTLEEKLNQLTLLSDGQMKENPAEARKPVGSVFSETDPVLINKLPARRGRELAPGHPDPVRLRHDPRLPDDLPDPARHRQQLRSGGRETDHRIGAFESAAVGLKQIYSPMVDLSHEPRWGRIAEAAGEDPYLNSVMAAARVKGAQGNDYSAPDKVVTSVKHFAAYGEPDAGRDYNTTDMSLQRLWNFYLPPFKAAVDAGSDTLMCSFNAINGVPGCANRYTGDQDPQEALGLRRVHRERLHGRGRAARLPG